MAFSEKQQLLDTRHGLLGRCVWNSFICVFDFLVVKPAVPSFRTGSPPETCWDSASELSQSSSDEDDLWRPGRLCQQTVPASGSDGDARQRARRRLFLAGAVSLVFMAGEMIGQQT